MERVNETLRYAWLYNSNLSLHREELYTRLTEWLIEHNLNQPHQLLAYLAPLEHIEKELIEIHSPVLPNWSASTILNVRQEKNDMIKRKNIKEEIMGTTRFVYWQDDDMWLGYLEEYPDYMTQGKSLDELKENLKDIYDDLTSGAIPYVRKVAELEIA